MYYALEMIILFGILWYSKKVLCNSLDRNLIGILSFLVAITISSLVFWVTNRMLSRLLDNWVLQLVGGCSIATLVYCLTWFFLKNLYRSYFAEKITTRVSANKPLRVFAKGVNVLLACSVMITAFLFADFMARLLSLAPQSNHKTNNSFIAGAMPSASTYVSEKKEFSANQTSEHDAILYAMGQQRRLFDTIRQGFRQTTTFLYEKTGAEVILEHLQFVKTLSQLSDEEKLWLIQTTPALQALVNNSSLQAIMQDERLLELILDASQGSLGALYQLGEEPHIKHLFQDKAFVHAIKHIHLKGLVVKVNTRKNMVMSTKLLSSEKQHVSRVERMF